MTLNLTTMGVPAQPIVFTDSGSVAHVGIGFLAGYLGPAWGLAIAAAFIGYQLSQADGVPWARTGGEVLEFALGVAAAVLMKRNA